MAAQDGHHEVVAALTAARANVDLAENNDCTPLLVAAQVHRVRSFARSAA